MQHISLANVDTGEILVEWVSYNPNTPATVGELFRRVREMYPDAIVGATHRTVWFTPESDWGFTVLPVTVAEIPYVEMLPRMESIWFAAQVHPVHGLVANRLK